MKGYINLTIADSEWNERRCDVTCEVNVTDATVEGRISLSMQCLRALRFDLRDLLLLVQSYADTIGDHSGVIKSTVLSTDDTSLLALLAFEAVAKGLENGH